MRSFIATATLTIAVMAVTGLTAPMPAFGQSWRLQPRVQREIQNDISQLDRQISRATERRLVSRNDAKQLRREASTLQRTFNRASRDGLDRREVQQLENQVNRLHARLRLERRDWAGHR